MPILEQFQPQIILVSSGFDACVGHAHPLGGYELTPTCNDRSIDVFDKCIRFCSRLRLYDQEIDESSGWQSGSCPRRWL